MIKNRAIKMGQKKQIINELTGEMITEERILEASFEMQEVTA